MFANRIQVRDRFIEESECTRRLLFDPRHEISTSRSTRISSSTRALKRHANSSTSSSSEDYNDELRHVRSLACVGFARTALCTTSANVLESSPRHWLESTSCRCWKVYCTYMTRVSYIATSKVQTFLPTRMVVSNWRILVLPETPLEQQRITKSWAVHIGVSVTICCDHDAY